MVPAIRGNGMRQTLLQHVLDEEMHMKIDDWR